MLTKEKDRLPLWEGCFSGLPVNGETVDCPLMGMWSEVACLLEDWAPPQDWRQVEVTPEAVGVSLSIVSKSFE